MMETRNQSQSAGSKTAIRLSVITVTRNNADGLRNTLASLRRQDLIAVEIIVVDGNSTDDTASVLSDFADIVSISTQDTGQGIYAAMNQGIELSQGDWLFFLNSGDEVFESSLNPCLQELESTTSEIVYGRTVSEGVVKATKPLADIWKGSRFSHQAVFIRKTLMQPEDYDTTFRIVADYHFFSGRYAAGTSFQELDLIVAEIEPGGLSSGPTIEKTREYIRAGKEHFPDRPIIRHHICHYLNHKLLIRKRFYRVTQVFWRGYHFLRQIFPKPLRNIARRTLKAMGRGRSQ